MHATLTAIKKQLAQVVTQLQGKLPNDEPFGNVHNNWSFPGLSKPELIAVAQSLVALIDDHADNQIDGGDALLKDYVRRLEHLRNQTIPQMWSNAGQAVPTYMLTLQGLRTALEAALKSDPQAEAIRKSRRLATRLRGLEARLNDLEPRTTSLSSMVERIEKAFEAADQLPTDLESLSEARKQIETLVKEASKDHGRIVGIRDSADQLDEKLNKSASDAKDVMEKCERAYSAATSVGLAAAFTERSHSLTNSMWIWVAGLVGALAAGSYFGSVQVQRLSQLLTEPNAGGAAISTNLFLAILSVGAPIWFSWLSTKQIGQRFRLAEDYAFKASISRAYEGFRREAARFDKEMEARLLSSALSRFDELPLRLVETETHGSPWHELASSDLVKQAMRAVPGFAEQVKNLAASTIASVPVKRKESGNGVAAE
jgi:hypothetical protein